VLPIENQKSIIPASALRHILRAKDKVRRRYTGAKMAANQYRKWGWSRGCRPLGSTPAM
jgi:hypothetical protein